MHFEGRKRTVKRKKKFAETLFLLTIFLVCSTIASSQTIQLNPEQALKFRGISDLRLSPDGRKIAFTVEEPLSGAKQNRDIWVLDTETRDIRQFTFSHQPDYSPRWAPDGKSLAFLSGRDIKPKIYLIPIDGGEAKVLIESKTAINAFAWSPDGKWISYLASEPETDEEIKRRKEKDDARVVDRDNRYPQLWIFDMLSRESRQLTNGNWNISEFIWNPDGKHLIVSANSHPQPELLTNQIYAVSVSDGTMQKIASPPQPYAGLDISPDGKRISFVGVRGIGGPHAHDLFVQSRSGDEAINISHQSIDQLVMSYSWISNQSILALVETGFTSAFFKCDLQGKAEKTAPFAVSPQKSFVANEKLLAFVGGTMVQVPEIWISLDSGPAEKVTHLNKEWESRKLITPEIIKYPSFDGLKIEAALLKPPGYKSGVRIPLIVLVHGGPTGRWSDQYHSWGQFLAQRGYAVLYPNIRGSEGYGYDFLIKNKKDWGGGDFKDVMAGVDFLVREEIVDPERLGIAGWSYGGYMAAWAVTQTNRFKAAVSGSPMTDLASEYGTEMAAMNAYDTWFLGSPYENLELFLERSPMTYVRNVKTPTLILCGEKDAVDPLGQSQQFYRGLKRYGVETELVVYPRVGHSVAEEKHRIDILRRLLGWFDKYLK